MVTKGRMCDMCVMYGTPDAFTTRKVAESRRLTIEVFIHAVGAASARVYKTPACTRLRDACLSGRLMIVSQKDVLAVRGLDMNFMTGTAGFRHWAGQGDGGLDYSSLAGVLRDSDLVSRLRRRCQRRRWLHCVLSIVACRAVEVSGEVMAWKGRYLKASGRSWSRDAFIFVGCIKGIVIARV